ncbi:hypothetical protein C9374_014420 [Naegleria lovaniensis]|uniref:Uncharacterized protein n=1 Tax=Naegleria lovaniensis TaxID=51637 RepID=A0AA88KMJ8_NAELO|nr:uncharacterized protein C9374_014420 [Naegleria lovaniensis]KAG2389020.1 hypothetical protein C9374_014420 [Naegleria lovaniensis]
MTERSASSLSKVSTTTSKSTNSKVSTSNNNNATATNSRPNSRIDGDGEVLSSEEKQAGQVISTETNQDESSPTIPNERSGDTFSAWKAFLSKLRSSVLVDYAEEKNRVAFRNQFFQHVKEVYKKLNLQEEDIIPRLEKIDNEGNWSSNAAHAIKADLFGSIEYNIKKQLEANKALREPKPIDELLFNVATTVSRDFTLSSICSKYFHDINLSSCKITEIDSEFVNYCKFLEVLSLSFNKLTSIRCLPQNLYGLTAYSNSISKIVPLKTFANIVHLGLGYNRLNNLAFVENCPYLASLDVSFNDLTSLEQSLQSLTKVPSLKTLNLQGNCFCLLEHYRGAVFSSLPKIETLDNESFSEESRKRYMDLFHGFSGDKKTKLVVTLSSLTGVNFDDEIKLIEDEITSTNDSKNGKKTPIKRIPSASKKKAPNAKKPSETTFFKSIYYVVRFSWPKEDDKDEISFIESNPVYLPDPDPKTNSKIVSIDFKDSFEFLISEKSLGVKHHIEKPLSFYIYRIVANIQDDDDSNKIELSRDLLGILFANFNEFWEKGFSLPVPIPEDDDSAKSGDELKALMKNSLEERHNLQNDVSTSSCSGLTMGVSITQPSEIWDNYEKDWKDPKKRKQALKTANANNKKPPSRK